LLEPLSFHHAWVKARVKHHPQAIGFRASRLDAPGAYVPDGSSQCFAIQLCLKHKGLAATLCGANPQSWRLAIAQKVLLSPSPRSEALNEAHREVVAL
jgi:hypothetical protein